MSDAMLSIVSHRCRGFGAPENSAAALHAAIESGVDEVEIDLRLSKDGAFFAFHFPWVQTGTWQYRSITKMSEAELLESGALSLDDAFTILDKAPSSMLLRLDVKSAGGEDTLVRHLENANRISRTSVMSLSWAILKTLTLRCPQLPTNLSFLVPGMGYSLDRMVVNPILRRARLETSNLKRITLVPLTGSVSVKTVEELSNDYEVTVLANSAAEMQTFQRAGAKKILTTRPMELTAFRREQAARV